MAENGVEDVERSQTLAALQHLINTQIHLAMHPARRTSEALPFPRGPAAAAGLTPEEMLRELEATSAVLGAVIRGADTEARASYGGDRTDRGIVAVACDELHGPPIKLTHGVSCSGAIAAFSWRTGRGWVLNGRAGWRR
jgi:hypothetical protein